MDMEGVEIAGQGQSVGKKISFDLPDFYSKEKVTWAEIGSYSLELIENCDLSQQLPCYSLRITQIQVQTSQGQSDKISCDKSCFLWHSILGQEIC